MNVRVDAMPGVETQRRFRAVDYVTLTKPRLSLFVVLTTFLGFIIASHGTLDAGVIALALAGTALSAGGAAALNMAMERGVDSRMKRTQARPVASGRVSVTEAVAWGSALSIGGVALLVAVNPLTAAIGALTVITYLFCYTPLKSKTSLCTVVGAVPGALPLVMGWTAATGTLAPGAVALFVILFFWQLPHFLALAWIYREDYARAGLPMLPVEDPSGASTGRQVIVQTLALIVAAFMPCVFGMAGVAYAIGAAIAGLGFLILGVRFALSRTAARAWRLFLGSLVYLPVVLALLAFGRGI